MTDACLRSAGYDLMIDNNPDQKKKTWGKTYATLSFGSKNFSLVQIKMSSYSKEVLANNMAFLEFAIILWETSKPPIVLTDNKSVTRLIQTNQLYQRRGTSDYMLQVFFKIAHIAGPINTAAEFLSRGELKVTQKINVKIWVDVQKTPLRLTTSSSDNVDEKFFFFTQADDENVWEKQNLRRKEQSRQDAKEDAIEANVRVWIEQYVDLALENLKPKTLGPPFDEVPLPTDRQYKNYEANDGRIILKDSYLPQIFVLKILPRNR